MFPRTRSLVAATLVLAIAQPALADDLANATKVDASSSEPQTHDFVAYDPPTRPSVRTTEWYGWQTLAADGVSLGTMPFELSSTSPSASYLFFASLSGYALGAPAVHAAHGRWKLAAADFGLRVGAVTLGSLAGVALGRPSTPSSCDTMLMACLSDKSNGLFIGATVGAIAASLLDASLLARDARPAESAPMPGPAPVFSWLPSASVVPGGATGGVMGTF